MESSRDLEQSSSHKAIPSSHNGNRTELSSNVMLLMSKSHRFWVHRSAATFNPKVSRSPNVDLENPAAQEHTIDNAKV